MFSPRSIVLFDKILWLIDGASSDNDDPKGIAAKTYEDIDAADSFTVFVLPFPETSHSNVGLYIQVFSLSISVACFTDPKVFWIYLVV